MRESVYIVLYVLVAHIYQGLAVDPGYNGGTMSFSVGYNGTSGKTQVTVDMLVGYKLGTGPCGAVCTEGKIGDDTSSTQTGFTWEVSQGFSPSTIDDITSTIVSSRRRTIIAINSKTTWEQEWLKAQFDLDGSNKKQTLYVSGLNWISGITGTGGMKMRSDISPSNRSDTGQPNRSPIVLMKPVYRVKAGVSTTVPISAIDPDGDFIKCSDGNSVQHGALASGSQSSIHVTEDCLVRIDAMTDGEIKGTGLDVGDYNKDSIKVGSGSFQGYRNSLSKTPVQFTVAAHTQLGGPVFVSPSMDNNQRIQIYIGATLTTPLCVRVDTVVLTVTFKVIEREGIEGKYFGTSAVTDDPARPHVKCTTFTWTPRAADIGGHVVCITAIDDTGYDSAEDRCFLTEVLEASYDKKTLPEGALYFVDVPTLIVTDSKTAVVVPIPVQSSVERPTVDVETTDISYEKGYLDSPRPDRYTQSFLLLEEDFGHKIICFNAKDNRGNVAGKTCLAVNYLPPDPCISVPCQNSGTCRRNDGLDVDFVCDCISGRTGKDCADQAADPCKPNPCIHGERCLGRHAPITCLCTSGFKGKTCEIDYNECATQDCGQNGVCIDGAHVATCKCFPGFSGLDCSTDTCSGNPTQAACTARTCSSTPTDPQCSCGTCMNGGLCLGGSSCECPYGFTGFTCDTKMSSSTGISFVPPTLEEGTTLTCYMLGTVLQPCYVPVAVSSSLGQPTRLIISQATGTFKKDSRVGTFRHQQGISIYEAKLSIKGTKDDGLNFFCTKAFYNTSSTERCFVLDYKINLVDVAMTFENSQKKKAIKFENPTPNPGSSFSCNQSNSCRLWLYTSRNATSCQHVQATGESVTVFPPILGDTTCKTEVLLRSSVSGTQDICFLAGDMQSTSQTRCFKMEVIAQGSDPCGIKPCLNDGLCIRNGTSGFYCMCDKGFSGKKCEKGTCVEENNNCIHGQCAVYETVTSCLCDIGYVGDRCHIEAHTSVGDAAVNGVQFTDMAIPSKIRCITGQPCTVVLAMSGQLPSGEIPLLMPGYVGPDVAVEQLSVKPTGSPTGSYKAELTVSSIKLGEHTVCIQSFNNSRVNKDELCFKIDVTADTMKIFNDEDQPHFIEPSLSPDSIMRCPFNETCHVWYTISPGPGNKADIQLSPSLMKTTLIRSNCEDTDSGHTCFLDVSMRPRQDEKSQSFDICVNLISKIDKAKGDSRCFKVSVEEASSMNDQRRCRQLQCENEGFCDGHASSAICYCPAGFAGSTCEQKYDPLLSSRESSITGDKAAPKTIGCQLQKVCQVPLQLYLSDGSCTSPQIRQGYVTKGLQLVKPTMTFVDEGNPSTNFSGIVELMPTQTGPQQICLQATKNSSTLIEVCFHIQVTDKPPANSHRPYFVYPTFSDEAVLYCEESTECHLSLHYTKGEQFNSAQACPEVRPIYPTTRPTLSSLKILRTAISDDKCTNDVYLKDTQSGITKTICFQLVLPQNIGEERCFNIEIVNDLTTKVKTPCDGVTCSPWEVCISNLTSTTAPRYTCVNDPDAAAFKRDSEDAMFVDLPQYTENLGCVGNTCTVPLYVQSPVREITVLGVTHGQNGSVFTIDPPVLWCHESMEVYKADLRVTSAKLDTSQSLCIVANDTTGMATDIACISPRPPESEGLNLGLVVGGAVGGIAVIGGGVAAGLFLRKKQIFKKILSRRSSKVATPESKKTSKNGSKNAVSVVEMDSSTGSEQITEIVLTMKVKKSK